MLDILSTRAVTISFRDPIVNFILCLGHSRTRTKTWHSANPDEYNDATVNIDESWQRVLDLHSINEFFMITIPSTVSGFSCFFVLFFFFVFFFVWSPWCCDMPTVFICQCYTEIFCGTIILRCYISLFLFYSSYFHLLKIYWNLRGDCFI